MNSWAFILQHWYLAISVFFGTLLVVTVLTIQRQFAKSAPLVKRMPFILLRNELRLLVIEDKLSEDSHIFEHYDRLLDYVIENAEEVNLSFFAALSEKYAQELKSERLAKFDEITKQLKASPEEIQVLVRSLYDELFRLFVKQSKGALLFGSLLVLCRAASQVRLPSIFKKRLNDSVTMFEVAFRARELGKCPA